MSKSRYDPFYFLAKKHGFRSRAAFKLIEINKHYKFLENSTGIIDLCAAPGSWIQVAKKISPNGSLILGIDAQKIRPIKSCYFLRGDISSSSIIKTILKIKKIDKRKINVILHDGAPKIGGNWLKDVFNQNEMVLFALKIGICTLENGGCFISKIFRSEFLHGILYISRCFFEKVKLFKPLSSRLSSTEIYLICINFKNPVEVDPLFFSTDYVFGFGQDILTKQAPLIKKKNMDINLSEMSFLNSVRSTRGKSTNLKVYSNFDDEFQCIVGINLFSNALLKKAPLNFYKRGDLFREKLLKKWCSSILEKIGSK